LISKDFLLLKYGSTVNGLSNKSNSDLDLTILIPDMDFKHKGYLSVIEKKLDKKRYEIMRSNLDSSGFIL
jgi:predicted nucleotidyltransferase